MSLKEAKKICDYQGIIPKLEIKVYCPSCGKKTLILNITEDKAYCIRCDKEYNGISEVLKIEEEHWLEKHKKLHMSMRGNKGVGY